MVLIVLLAMMGKVSISQLLRPVITRHCSLASAGLVSLVWEGGSFDVTSGALGWPIETFKGNVLGFLCVHKSNYCG
ncbi:hypothetical protein B0H65DRAFT_456702 [Neurospora tetraspora]|uniref:Secreted protein n=1 Tax=Neurospora tetraspora TaxID=94610 RepID=A0AAE0JJS0_9PEZI|nr:hypothetical protein B0H65DRAFT_456702 [Neurospora tetraspora]